MGGRTKPLSRQWRLLLWLRADLNFSDTEVTTSTFNTRIVSLRLFFGVTCGREEMKRYMQFRRKPRMLPVVLSVEEIGDLLAAVPGPGLTYRVALGISYGAGLRASEVCHLKVVDIDSGRMLIHVDEGKNGKDRKAMLSPGLTEGGLRTFDASQHYFLRRNKADLGQRTRCL